MQAQTVANFYLAFELDLAVVAVINKIDLPAADPNRVASEIEAAFDLPATSAIHCSAKSGIGVGDILQAVVEKIPPPAGDEAAPFRLLLFDAHADEFRGVVCMVLVKDGVVRRGDKLRSCSTGDTLEVIEVCNPSSRNDWVLLLLILFEDKLHGRVATAATDWQRVACTAQSAPCLCLYRVEDRMLLAQWVNSVGDAWVDSTTL
jgi:translation elongation factor EF-G